jgi:hypothetical protein
MVRFIKVSLALSNRVISWIVRTKALTTLIPARFSCRTVLSRSSRCCINKNMLWALRAKSHTNPAIKGTNTATISAKRGLVKTRSTIAPAAQIGARVRMRSDRITTICTELTSLVDRTMSLPVWRWSRFPKEKDCTFRISALRRLAPNPIAAYTESELLTRARTTERIEAPTI